MSFVRELLEFALLELKVTLFCAQNDVQNLGWLGAIQYLG